MLDETPSREHVRGFVLNFAAKATRFDGVRLNVRHGRKFQNGAIITSYAVVDGKWKHSFGPEVRGLDGLDAAGCYMAHYEGLSHVTREYAERQTA